MKLLFKNDSRIDYNRIAYKNHAAITLNWIYGNVILLKNCTHMFYMNQYNLKENRMSVEKTMVATSQSITTPKLPGLDRSHRVFFKRIVYQIKAYSFLNTITCWLLINCRKQTLPSFELFYAIVWPWLTMIINDKMLDRPYILKQNIM